MKKLLFTLLIFLISFSSVNAAEPTRIRLNVDEIIEIQENPSWNITIEKELQLRFADIKIKPQNGYPFSMMLYFKCDTKDLAQFDSPEKIARSITSSSEKYLPYILEKKITLQPIPIKSTYGYLTVLTDAEVSKMAKSPQGEFKYMTRGMVRISKDSALGFSIMSNDITSTDYNSLLNYVYSYVND